MVAWKMTQVRFEPLPESSKSDTLPLDHLHLQTTCAIWWCQMLAETLCTFLLHYDLVCCCCCSICEGRLSTQFSRPGSEVHAGIGPVHKVAEWAESRCGDSEHRQVGHWHHCWVSYWAAAEIKDRCVAKSNQFKRHVVLQMH